MYVLENVIMKCVALYAKNNKKDLMMKTNYLSFFQVHIHIPNPSRTLRRFLSVCLWHAQHFSQLYFIILPTWNLFFAETVS